MIEAGKSFCPHCLRAQEGAYYSNSDISWGVWLKHSRFTGKYSVTPEDFGRGTLTDGVIVLESCDKNALGLPNGIQVSVVGGRNPHSSYLYRACPECARENRIYRELPDGIGQYDTFVIPLIGPVSAGKSAWLEAISIGRNTKAVNDCHYERRLEYLTPADNEKKPKATDPRSRGQSKVLKIYEGQQVVALVYLVDVGGELYQNTAGPSGLNPAAKKEIIWKLLNRNEEYPGADALVFVESAVKDKHTADPYSANEIYRDLVRSGLLKNKPLAYVMTHADKLIESGDFRKVTSAGGREVAVMTGDTFKLQEATSYAPEDLRTRTALEHFITQAYGHPSLSRLDGPSKGFLVRSCELRRERHSENGRVKEELIEDFTKSMNVMDPLLWLLYQLKLFPLG